MRPITTPTYFDYYIALNAGDDIVAIYEAQLSEMIAIFENISPEKAEFAYQEGKWNIKELLGHLTDTERIMSYRAMCIARRDETSFPGFDEDEYVRQGHFSHRSLGNILAEFISVRKATIALAATFNTEDMLHIGTANGVKTDVSAILYMIAGHATHHLKVLKDKYLSE